MKYNVNNNIADENLNLRRIATMKNIMKLNAKFMKDVHIDESTIAKGGKFVFVKIGAFDNIEDMDEVVASEMKFQ